MCASTSLHVVTQGIAQPCRYLLTGAPPLACRLHRAAQLPHHVARRHLFSETPQRQAEDRRVGDALLARGSGLGHLPQKILIRGSG